MKIRPMLGVALLALSMITSGCFGRSEAQEAVPIRTPRPTFTPTPPQQQPATPEAPAVSQPAAENAAPLVDAQPAPEQPAAAEQPAAQPAEPAEAAPQSAIAVVNEDLINIRRGPGLQYPVLKLGMRGDQYTLIGRSADDEWWQICCIEELPGWITQQYVDADGPVDGIAVADPDAEVQALVVSPPTPEPVATAAPVVEAAPQVEAAPESVAEAPPAEAAPAEPPAPAFEFNLATQERFPENNNLVRVFLYVSQGDTAVPGYSLRVVHDGVEMPVSATSADAAGMTWPTASPRQRFQNMKVEFPGVNAAGTWEIQLIDGGKAPAGPVATFTLAATDTDRELYVRYEKP